MIRVILVGPDTVAAQIIVNPNAFPQAVRRQADACSDRLAVLAHSVRTVREEVARDGERFFTELRSNPSFAGFQPDPAKPACAYYRNVTFLSGLYSALISTKSLLDVYARLVSRTLFSRASVFGFNSGSYNGRKIPGGAFLNWLTDSAPPFENRGVLISTVVAHVERWISEAVGCRDDVVHKGALRLSEMALPLDRPVPDLRSENIVPPKMPNGIVVTDYCNTLKRENVQLLQESFALLPNVDRNLLSSTAP